jgi:FkbM family methyltransferase
MINKLKKYVRKFLKLFDYEIHRISILTNPSLQLVKGLAHHKIDVVLDIGANAGQFGEQLRNNDFIGRIISFEPLPDAHALLTQNASTDSHWHVHTRCALGNYDGETVINIAGNSVSSSLLPMLQAHSSVAKDSAYIGTIDTPIARLDAVAGQYLRDAERYFIKIDTQGFEWQVLEGASETLKNATGVLCELSLVPLYESQRLWLEVVERLRLEGFTLWSLQQVFCDVRSSRTLQVDAIFFRV